ncbi:MAG: class I SAM-dependent methyltransferase [Candidatus Marsarchaeota archaeon]|nr:class I SAM-dependent methyltransferase [Candidatus Marsarchaeota archaeon]MCL5095104.1 class I SAM-dependent methyltransferase [Candidatus Marsarchaeota archaeon]
MLNKKIKKQFRKGNKKELYKKNEEHFGKITSHLYSFAVNLGFLKIHDFVYKDIIKNIKQNTKSILDIGCGNGLILKKLAEDKKTKNIRLYGIDPSEEMVKIAEKKLKKLNKKAVFKLGSSRLISFKRKFDIIYTTLSYHHWSKKEQAIPYILSKLNKNGSFIIYEYNKNIGNKFTLMQGHKIDENEFEKLDFKKFKKIIIKTQDIIKVEFKNI